MAESIVYEDGNIQLAKKSEYKYKFIVSTPIEIVKYMVKNTLQPLCEGKNPQEIKKLKVIDISCGSGIFLQEAYQFLLDYCTQWYMKNDLDYLLEIDNGKRKLPLQQKKEILLSCIYGVDIDIHAVEVSKFSLLLKLIENETEPSVKSAMPILPDLSFNEEVESERIVLSYYNSISFAFSELCGRSYGGGVLEILPREVGNIIVPKLDNLSIEEVRELLKRIDLIVRSEGDIEQALDIVDNEVLVNQLGIDSKMCQMARQIWKKMQKRRLKRG